MSVVVSQLVGRVSIEGADQAQNNLKQVGSAASTLGEKLSTIKPYNAGTAITAVDVATAKLTLLESQVTQAHEKLQTLQNAADVGEAVKGIPEAEAQLTLLQSKAQQARAGLQELQAAGAEADAGLQQLDTGTQEANTGLGSLLTRLKETAGQMANGFLSSVKETASNLSGGLLTGIRETTTNLTGGFFGGIKNAASGLLDFTSKIGFAYQGIQMLYQGAIGLGKALLEPNASMEQTQVAFKGLLGSSSAAAAELKDLQQFAASTPFQFPELADSTQKLLAFQFPLKETKPLLTAIGDSLSALGEGTPAKLSQVVDVFGQMNAAGKLQTQDLMQLTSVGINGFQLLADQMHKPVSVIKDMVTSGTIPAQQGIELLRQGMEKTFGGGMAAQAQTFNGLLSTFKDNIGSAWRAFTGPLFDKAKSGLQDMGNLVSAPVFQDFAAKAGKEVGDVFKHIGDAVKFVGDILHSINLTDFKEAWHAVSFEVGYLAQRFKDLFASSQPVAGSLNPISEILHNLATGGLKIVTDLLWDFSQAFITVDKGIQDGSGPLGLLKPLFQDVSGALKQIDFKAIVADLKPFVQALLNMSPGAETIKALSAHAKELGTWFQTSVIPAFKQAEPGFKNLGQALGGLLPIFIQVSKIVGDTFQHVFTALLPVFEKAIPLIIKISGIIADGLGAAIKFLAPYIVVAAQALGKFADEIATRIAPIMTNWIKQVSDGIDDFLVIWKAVWPFLAPILKGVWDEIMGVVKIAWALVSGIIKVGLDLMSGNWKQAWEDCKDMLSGVWDGIKTYLSGAMEIVIGMFRPLLAALSNIPGPVGDMAKKALGSIDGMQKGANQSLATMKAQTIEHTAQMQSETAKKLDGMRQNLITQMKNTSDPVQKHALAMKIGVVSHAEEMHLSAAKSAQEMATKVVAHAKNMSEQSKASATGIGPWFSDRYAEAKNGIINAWGTMGQWFQDRWHETQHIFSGVGKWFADRFQEAKTGITNAFGSLGQWFHDRFMDIATAIKPFTTFYLQFWQTIWNILVAIIGKVGTWFHDRFVEVMGAIKTATAPIRAWFADRWHDIQNIFSGVAKWFQDRFTEAWKAITTVFSALGRWFQDRWNEVAKVFSGVGSWFKARFQEAWNGITSLFTIIGHWFQDRWNEIVRVFANVGSWFKARFQEAWNGITSLFATVGKWFSDRWNDVVGGVIKFKDSILGKFNETKTGVTNIFRDMINGIIDQLNNGISAVENFINFFGQGLNNVAKALGTTGTIPVAHLGRIAHYATGTPAGGHPGGPMIVGEEGPELLVAPRGTAVLPHDKTMQLLKSSQSSIPGYANGVGDIATNILSWIGGGAQSVLDHVIKSLNIQAPNMGGMGNISGAIFEKVKSWALGWIESILPKFSFGGGAAGSPTNVPGNVQSWITSAMALTHVPSNWAGALATIAMHESGGNPNAVNNWDVNAKNGDPSRGLFQTIGSTFAAYMLPGHGNILAPLDNSIAAIRYIQARYGTVFNVPGIQSLASGGSYVGYANGVESAPGGWSMVGERGPEAMYVPRGSQIVPNHHLGQLARAQSSGQGATIILELNGRQFARAVLPDITNTIRYDLGSKF